MPIILALPVLGIALMLQTAVVSRITLLSGSADLILTILAAWSLQERVSSAWVWGAVAGILVGSISGLPLFIPLAGYLLVVGLARILQRRVWQAPFLATFFVVFVGTFGMQLLTAVYLLLTGGTFSVGEAISRIILPSTLLNLLLVIPVYSLMKDLAQWVYPSEVDV